MTTSDAQWNSWLSMLRNRCIAELRDPSGGFPVDRANRAALAATLGLDSEIKDHEMAELSYFEKIGRNMSKLLCDETLRQHLGQGPMAYDAMPAAMRPRGGRNYNGDQAMPMTSSMPSMGTNLDQDPNSPEPNGEMPSEVDQCIATVQHWLEMCRRISVGKLAALIQSAHGMGEGDPQGRANVPPTGMDRVVAKNRAALDRAYRANRAAMDSALARDSNSFNRRWGSLAGNISFSGTGR